MQKLLKELSEHAMDMTCGYIVMIDNSIHIHIWGINSYIETMQLFKASFGTPVRGRMIMVLI